MKKILLLISTVFSCLLAFAAHITGGEMFYTLESQSGDSYTYRITLKLYRDCFSSGAQLDPSVPIAIFRNDVAHTRVLLQLVSQSDFIRQNLSAPNPCIQNPPQVCYETGYYTFNATLPAIPEGYTITYQRCCRIAGINNLVNSSGSGATYTASIPGNVDVADAPANTSARFFGIDTVITCANNTFCYNFGASDRDGDSLAYGFATAFIGGSQGDPAPNPPTAPIGTSGEYSTVLYSSSYSAMQPLGPKVTIDSRTGLMCGIAPPPGIYVVTVAVREYRKGKLIATQRKDLQIKVGDCNVADADLKPEYITCDGFTYTFSNEAPPNALVKTYYWELSDGFVSTDPRPTHTFADTGIYNIKLVVNRGQECSDSVTSRIKVYPGFFPGFTIAGVCVNKPTQFRDTTSTRYGVVDTWRWDFGDQASVADTSRAQHPAYTYTGPGTKSVRFIVTNSKGCIDTVQKDIEILTRPPLSVAFKDTLICTGDSVQLKAIGSGNFSWTPASNIMNANTDAPTVFPPSTASYVVQLDDQGCLANDTVRIRVVNFVTLQAMADTTICATDALQLRASSDGLRFSWDNAGTLDNPNSLTPIARPVANPATYTVTARIGRCSATDQVVVTSVPYPAVNAGNDTTICFNSAAQLNGATDGSSFSWAPAGSLSNANSLTPRATPVRTTQYILTAFDTRGCPKPGRDTVMVVVNPEVKAFAGRDTAVVIGQVLQFNASGGESYSWSPPTALSSTTIANPKAVYDGSIDSVRYKVVVGDSIGCTDDATVLVKIFRTNPRIFVPTAFTPNGDGKNEFVAPVAVGFTKIDYFRIYNRWGQLVFETSINGKGWDGKIGGREQSSATYVWIVKGTDFTGKEVFEKGTVTLIR
jgi:gliding motility-associated-like protein